MDVILNLWQEQLHEIVISTQHGRKLRLHIDQDTAGYCLVGEFYEVSDCAWYMVEFTNQRVNDAEELLKGCLNNLNREMQEQSDSIAELHNTCNDPIVSVETQKNICISCSFSGWVAADRA